MNLVDFSETKEANHANKVVVPPIKCQGIKTKLVPFIKANIKRDDSHFWIEPFMGTGVVAFNIQPTNAILSDKNQHIINFYKGIQDGAITGKSVKSFLVKHGANLKEKGAAYYKEMRNQFNDNHDPLYFLFLNRADFNGMIRFNRHGEFNVPFCQKPERFSKAYITKICNQVDKIASIIKGKNWQFICCNWQETMKMAKKGDYIYLDPPYIGRDTSYVGEWPVEEAIELAEMAHKTEASVCLSMWKENEFRKNDHLFKYWDDFRWVEQEHFYHIGAKESNRHPMIEILAIKER